VAIARVSNVLILVTPIVPGPSAWDNWGHAPEAQREIL
jgi:hypothetical protein